jgi:hypothetical protein
VFLGKLPSAPSLSTWRTDKATLRPPLPRISVSRGFLVFFRDVDGQLLLMLLPFPFFLYGVPFRGLAEFVISPADFDLQLLGRAANQNAEARGRRHIALPSGSWFRRRGIVGAARIADGVHRVGAVFIHLLTSIGIERRQKPGQVPARGSLRQDFGRRAKPFAWANQVELQSIGELAANIDRLHQVSLHDPLDRVQTADAVHGSLRIAPGPH